VGIEIRPAAIKSPPALAHGPRADRQGDRGLPAGRRSQAQGRLADMAISSSEGARRIGAMSPRLVRTRGVHSRMMAETKTQRVHLRVAASDDELFRSAAAMTQESLSSSWWRAAESGPSASSPTAPDSRCQPAQWRTFTAALDRPAREIPAVVELFRRSRPE